MADQHPNPELSPGAAAGATARLAITTTLCVFQYWLLTSTTEAYNAGNMRIALPAFLASIACFALAVGLVFTGEYRARKAETERDIE
jgi:hypothetical protein